jgi:hypothetical protein
MRIGRNTYELRVVPAPLDRLVDEQGNEREVDAPRGRFTRWLW